MGNSWNNKETELNDRIKELENRLNNLEKQKTPEKIIHVMRPKSLPDALICDIQKGKKSLKRSNTTGDLKPNTAFITSTNPLLRDLEQAMIKRRVILQTDASLEGDRLYQTLVDLY